MTNAAAIIVDDLRVVRGKRVVLPGLDCEFARGRITGLLGPSGSGKTTLMRAIVGVQRVHGGAVTVLGCPAGHPQLRRTVAYMTQTASVYADLSVRENIHYFARLAGASTVRVKDLLDQLGLDTHASALAGTLSGGQLSRVSLACALVGDPEILVLDEPTVGQDPLLRAELWDEFRARADAGTTILVSSHVMDEAARCHDVLLLRDGEAVGRGTPASLLARTGTSDVESAFVALITAPRTMAGCLVDERNGDKPVPAAQSSGGPRGLAGDEPEE